MQMRDYVEVQEPLVGGGSGAFECACVYAGEEAAGEGAGSGAGAGVGADAGLGAV